MSEVIDFERARLARSGASSAALLVGGLDAVLAHLGGLEPVLATQVRGRPVRFVREEGSDETPDVILPAHGRIAPERRPLFFTLSGETYEQDDRGLVYADGTCLWPEPPAEVGVPTGAHVGGLRAGKEAGLLFLCRVDSGWQIRVRVTSPLLVLVDPPAVRPHLPTLRGWLALAVAALLQRPAS